MKAIDLYTQLVLQREIICSPPKGTKNSRKPRVYSQS